MRKRMRVVMVRIMRGDGNAVPGVYTGICYGDLLLSVEALDAVTIMMV